MSARYHVLCSDQLMASSPQWPDGLRPVEQEPTDPARYPGMHWWLFADRGAQPTLDGKRVELTFGARYKRPIWHRVLRLDRPARKVPVILTRSVI